MTTLATVAFAFAMLSAIGIVVLFVLALAAADAEDDQWRTVSGVEVSSSGLVRDLRGRPLRAYEHSRGYRCVYVKSRQSTTYIHRLVAEAFHGVAPSGSHEVNHKNGDKADNRASNLEWVTPDENRLHAFRSGLIETAVTENEINAVRFLRERGVSAADLGRALGVDGGKVSRIHRGRYYGYVPRQDPVARICAWCATAASKIDVLLAGNGAEISHGICDACKKKVLDDLH